MPDNPATESPEAYDATHFDPPAPVARVTLRAADGGVTVADVLVDTGADTTLLPRAAVERLGVPVLTDQTYELVGLGGARSFAPSVMLDMLFLRRAYRGRYLLIEEERGILGRDVLNHVVVLLDGPRGQWSEQP